ncbi:MAG: T9SS type A sorting domain-containing protein, partial [Schleiferiaceae bacterium]|nr:T9SS type A sorting domain-containing protein [Schleiferiaceae bacterium]
LNRVANSAAFSGKSIRSSGNDVKSLTLQFPSRSYSIDSIRFLAPYPQYQKTTQPPYLVIIDPQNQTIYSDTAIGYQNLVWTFALTGLILDKGTNYRIELHQFENEIVLFKPHSLPYMDKTGTMHITGAEYNHYGVNKNDAFPYLEFEFASSITVREKELDAKIYPNQTAGILAIEANEDWSFLMYDLTGRLVETHNSTEGQKIDLSLLPAGTYLYEILSTTNQSKRDKLIVY